MKVVQVPLKKAQEVKVFLQEKKVLDMKHPHIKKDNFLYFPLLKKMKLEYPIFEMNLDLKERKSLRSVLKEELTKKELLHLRAAYDTVGTIAIVEIDSVLEPKEKRNAELLLQLDKKIKTVLKKEGIHEGEFRTQKLMYLAGENTKETTHRENGVHLKLNVETVYFSPRLSTERKRILTQIKPDENILVMFSGCGPYCVVFSKNSKAKKIIGVEINPEGHKYALENISLNNTKNVALFCGDVRKVVPSLGTFDRIIMPLPKSAETFLDIAISASKSGTIIHLYDFAQLESMPDVSYEKIKNACFLAKKKYTILGWNKCGQFGPGKFRVCIDFKID